MATGILTATPDGAGRFVQQAPSTSNSRGRPLGEKALAIREAVLALQAEHQVMTVRQIFYALTVRGVVPKDESAGYRPVQHQVLRMRREGLLPWEFVADATRWMRKPTSYDSAEDALDACARTYRRDLWRSQDLRAEVWLEKDALAGVVMEATVSWDVPLMVSRGTSSATFLYEAAQHARRAWAQGIETFVFALYDRDAAGLRCARTVAKGLEEYAAPSPVEFELLAVTPGQIREWSLPTRPAKTSDPEAAKFDGPAVELDAIPPDRLIALVSDAIEALVDPGAWRAAQVAEQEERELLLRLAGGGIGGAR